MSIKYIWHFDYDWMWNYTFQQIPVTQYLQKENHIKLSNNVEVNFVFV